MQHLYIVKSPKFGLKSGNWLKFPLMNDRINNMMFNKIINNIIDNIINKIKGKAAGC